MRYRHQALDLKQSPTAEEMEKHMKLLRQMFGTYSCTGYYKPDGGDWVKDVRRNSYDITSTDGDFGIAIGHGDGSDPDDKTWATVYPKLGFAVLADSWELGMHRGREKIFVERLGRLGYKIAGKRAVNEVSRSWKTMQLKPAPYLIACEETGFLRTSEVFEHVIRNVNAVVSGRIESEFCEIVVFAPPGDGGLNSPIGRTKKEQVYGWWEHNFKARTTIRVTENGVNWDELAKVFYEMGPEEALGVSSKRMPYGQSKIYLDTKNASDVLYSGDYQTPMIDFQCSTPEEAVHMMERIGINFKDSGAVLLDSGASFHAHFPGFTQDLKQMGEYLERLEREDEVCSKWVPLQREQNHQLLRVSPCVKKPKIPVVLDL